jgi:hypothetical protein
VRGRSNGVATAASPSSEIFDAVDEEGNSSEISAAGQILHHGTISEAASYS